MKSRTNQLIHITESFSFFALRNLSTVSINSINQPINQSIQQHDSKGRYLTIVEIPSHSTNANPTKRRRKIKTAPSAREIRGTALKQRWAQGLVCSVLMQRCRFLHYTHSTLGSLGSLDTLGSLGSLGTPTRKCKRSVTAWNLATTRAVCPTGHKLFTKEKSVDLVQSVDWAQSSSVCARTRTLQRSFWWLGWTSGATIRLFLDNKVKRRPSDDSILVVLHGRWDVTSESLWFFPQSAGEF